MKLFMCKMVAYVVAADEQQAAVVFSDNVRPEQYLNFAAVSPRKKVEIGGEAVSAAGEPYHTCTTETASGWAKTMGEPCLLEVRNYF
jgi:hypothetical protein